MLRSTGRQPQKKVSVCVPVHALFTLSAIEMQDRLWCSNSSCTLHQQMPLVHLKKRSYFFFFLTEYVRKFAVTKHAPCYFVHICTYHSRTPSRWDWGFLVPSWRLLLMLLVPCSECFLNKHGFLNVQHPSKTRFYAPSSLLNLMLESQVLCRFYDGSVASFHLCTVVLLTRDRSWWHCRSRETLSASCKEINSEASFVCFFFFLSLIWISCHKRAYTNEG